jgi:hypothetical protein
MWLSGNQTLGGETDLADLLFAHAPGHIALVLEDEEGGAHQSLHSCISVLSSSHLNALNTWWEPYLLYKQLLQLIPTIAQA